MEEKDIIISIGKKLREIRKGKSMILSDLAKKANISTAMISKVENGRTVPSLPVLLTLLDSLDEDPGNFFRGITLKREKPFLVIRSDEFSPLEKEGALGYDYQLVLDKILFTVGFEIVLFTVHPGARRDKTQTDAFEFKYMLTGSCVYQIGEEVVELHEGDALFFDGRIPHNPENHGDSPAKMLVIYFYLEDNPGS